MQIAEGLATWQEEFESGWRAHFKDTGEVDWKRYPKLRNTEVPAGPAIELASCRLGLISTAGGYLPASQEPFVAADQEGDYSLRTFPAETPLDALAYAHEHYDHTAVNADGQVLMPLRHLEALVDEGKVGALAPTVISYSGYTPDLGRVVGELIPAVLDAVRSEKIEAALLVPS